MKEGHMSTQCFKNAIVIRMHNRKTIMFPKKDASDSDAWHAVHYRIIKDDNKENLIGWDQIRGNMYRTETFITNEMTIAMGIMANEYGQHYFNELNKK